MGHIGKGLPGFDDGRGLQIRQAGPLRAAGLPGAGRPGSIFVKAFQVSLVGQAEVAVPTHDYMVQ